MKAAVCCHPVVQNRCASSRTEIVTVLVMYGKGIHAHIATVLVLLVLYVSAFFRVPLRHAHTTMNLSNCLTIAVRFVGL